MHRFRHDPTCRIRPFYADLNAFDWECEPLVTAFRLFTYFNKTQKKEYTVPISATPVIVGESGILACSDDGYIRLLSGNLSKIYWERRLPASIYSSPIYIDKTDSCICAATDGTVASLSVDGTLNWVVRLDDPIYASAVVMDDSLFISTFNQRLYCLETTSGKIIAQSELPKPWGVNVDAIAAFRDPYSTPCVYADSLVIVACGATVSAFAKRGELIWRTQLSSNIRSSPASATEYGKIAVGLINGEIVFLDALTGEVISCIHSNAKIVHSPAISGKILCVGNERGDVLGIDLESGQMKWHYFSGAQLDHTSMTLTPAGDFVFLTKRGNAIGLSALTGKFLWETTQNLQLPNHEQDMHTTPIISPSGVMYCASYSGYLYRFNFRMKGNDDSA